MLIEESHGGLLREAYRKLNKGFTEQAIVELTELLTRLTKADPMYAETALILGDAERIAGRYDSAYLHMLEAFQLNSELQKNIPIEAVFTCLARLTQVPPDCEIVDQHIRDFLNHAMTINSTIDGIVKCYLMPRLGIAENVYSTIEMDTLCSDITLLSALSKLILANRQIELALIVVRKELLMLSIEGRLTSLHLGLISAFGERAILNDYVNPLDEYERTTVDEMLLSLGDLNIVSLDACKYDLMILSMYMPFHLLPSAHLLKTLPVEKWPAELQEIAQETLFDYLAEQGIAAEIPSLVAPSSVLDENLVSKAVRAQYEVSPYPRWEKVGVLKHKKSYSQHYKSLMNHPLFQSKVNFDLLVAGCGTGEHPLLDASAIKNLNITAIDLSRQSLAYAERKRRDLNADSVRFYQCDILDLDRYTGLFDIIESVGVLHHMEDPELGLAKLLTRLKPNGILQLGLYSKLARVRFEGIQRENRWIANTTLAGSFDADKLVELRNKMLVSKDVSLDWTDHAVDFYNLSGFRDLLFHVKEHQYTVAMIADTLRRFDLKFLGFNMDPKVMAHYQSLYPEDKRGIDLQCWAEFEEKFPDTFLAMYNFHCSKVN